MSGAATRKRAVSAEKKLEPFVIWMGGKRRLLRVLRENYPRELLSGDITTYIEPFVGGGAVFLDVMSSYDTITHSVINDINPNLINIYRVIRDDYGALCEELLRMREIYYGSRHTMEQKEEYYYENRDAFNAVINDDLVSHDIRRAALMIFLNKTCFSGLYRVNRSGRYNAAFGKGDKPFNVDADTMRRLSETFSETTILLGGYEEAMRYADASSFVYIDPPYRALSSTANFTKYDASVFADAEQVELKSAVDACAAAGAKVLLSNSDPKNTDPDDDFFDDLYADYTVIRVPIRRTVSVKASTRGVVQELLVKNYDAVSAEEHFGCSGCIECASLVP